MFAGTDPIGELLEAGDRRADQCGSLPVELVGAGRQVVEWHTTEPLDGPPVAVSLGWRSAWNSYGPVTSPTTMSRRGVSGIKTMWPTEISLHELDEHRRVPIECFARGLGTSNRRTALYVRSRPSGTVK